jgi:hypothetical protein
MVIGIAEGTSTGVILQSPDTDLVPRRRP